MVTEIDLHDVQGNIVRGYASFGYRYARYLLYRIDHDDHARKILGELLPLVTTSHEWRHGRGSESGDEQPSATTNISFTYLGLRAIGVPTASLHTFPVDFAMGMKARRDILNDNGGSSPQHWDKIWENDVHMLVSINGLTEEAIEQRFGEICEIVKRHHSGIELLSGHSQDGSADYQSAAALKKNGQPTAQEHFGYRDGVSNPFFEGANLNEANIIGGGKPNGGDPSLP